MRDFQQALVNEVALIRDRGLHRQLQRIESAASPEIRLGGATCLNFSSNDYLGLANDPVLKEAAARAVRQFGVGSGGSRLLCGSLAPHHELEEALADFKGTEAALGFSSGYAAALGTMTALLGKDDVVIIDRLAHACLVDAARLCGAKLRVFRHNDIEDLDRILRWATQERTACRPAAAVASLTRPKRLLIATESVFSMDGDGAPLKEIIAVKEKYGAWLMLDEAHATGLYGSQGRGLADAEGVSSRIEIQMATLGKALGAAGGAICGSRPLIELLVNRARSFIYSTAPSPVIAAAAQAGIRFVRSCSGEERRRQLWARVHQCRTVLAAVRSEPMGVETVAPVCGHAPFQSAIIPVLIGDENRAVEIAGALRERGMFLPAVRYPTVPRRQARLRLTVSAVHTPEQIVRLGAALSDLSLAT